MFSTCFLLVSMRSSSVEPVKRPFLVHSVSPGFCQVAVQGLDLQGTYRDARGKRAVLKLRDLTFLVSVGVGR